MVRVPGHYEGRAAAVKTAQRQCTSRPVREPGRCENRAAVAQGSREPGCRRQGSTATAPQLLRAPGHFGARAAAAKSAQRVHSTDGTRAGTVARAAQQQSNLRSGTIRASSQVRDRRPGDTDRAAADARQLRAAQVREPVQLVIRAAGVKTAQRQWSATRRDESRDTSRAAQKQSSLRREQYGSCSR